MKGEVNEILTELREMKTLSSFSKSRIEHLYRLVLDKEFTRTACNDCYNDAIIEIILYIKKNGKMKEKRNYKLKNGVLLQIEFGDDKFYTNDNLTDEIAEDYLRSRPQQINKFADFPENWEKQILKKKKKKEE